VSASTCWLRHTFANSAVKQMQPKVLQSLPGHSDLRVTSVYLKADAADLVRVMRAMERAASSPTGDVSHHRASSSATPPKQALAGGAWYGTTPRFGRPREGRSEGPWYGTTDPLRRSFEGPANHRAGSRDTARETLLERSVVPYHGRPQGASGSSESSFCSAVSKAAQRA
jgi:hypothetical protein